MLDESLTGAGIRRVKQLSTGRTQGSNKRNPMGVIVVGHDDDGGRS
jgi:hypothetical protein